MISRRTMVAGLSAAALDRALAQQPAQRRIGWLSPRSARTERGLDVFLRGLEQTGFVEGRNLVIEYRHADGDFGRLPGLAKELVGLKVELIVANGGGGLTSRPIRAVSTDMPIIFATGNNPVADGLVESLARPGRRTTGIWIYTSQLGPKRMELLQEIVPSARDIAFLINPRGGSFAAQEREMKEAASGNRASILTLYASTAEELDAAFQTMEARRVGGLLMGADTFFQVERDRIIAHAARLRLPTMYEWPEFVHAGGLMSYATATDGTWVQLGSYAGRILQGEDPGSLPVVQSATFALTLNLKTAREQGIAIPPAFLARADEVIE